MKNVLLLGGTGAMGAYLCDILAGMQDFSVFSTTRSKKNAEKINYIIGNAMKDDFLYQILDSKRWDVIVDFMCYSTSKFKSRYEKLLSATDQYIFISSSRVYASSATNLTEESPRLLDVCQDIQYVSSDEYAIAKARQEDLIRKSGYKNWTIVRPYVTYSKYRLQLSCEEKESWLYRALYGRTIVISEDLLSTKTCFTYGYDVALSIASLIGNKNALSDTIHITNGETYTWRDILEIYLNAIERNIGSRPKVMIQARYQPFFGSNMPTVRYDRLYNRVFDNNKLRNYIDTGLFHSVNDSLPQCVKEFVKNPKWNRVNWTQEAYKDRLTREFVTFGEFVSIPTIKTKIKYLLIRFGLYNPKLV